MSDFVLTLTLAPKYTASQTVFLGGVQTSVQTPAPSAASVYYGLKGDQGIQGIPGAGGGAATVTTVAASYTETSTSGSKAILCNAVSGAIVVTLPSAVGNTATFTFKKIDSSANLLTIDGAGTETLDGSLTAVLRAQYESITIVSDGANWSIV